MASATDAVNSPFLLFELEAVDGLQEQKDSTGRSELWRTLQVLGAAQTHFEARLLEDLQSYKRLLKREEGVVDTVVLATRLAAVGYKVAIRTAVGGGSGQKCFHNLHYEFLLVTEESSDTEHIVDPRFREQFQISQSTEEYQELLTLVPVDYVGTEARLVPMVKLLCAQMQESFQASGLTCPPWRQADSMISKWIPSEARDVDVETLSSSLQGKVLGGMSPQGPLSRSNSGATTSSSTTSFRSLGRPQAYQSSMVSDAFYQPLRPAKPMVRQEGFAPKTEVGSRALISNQERERGRMRSVDKVRLWGAALTGRHMEICHDPRRLTCLDQDWQEPRIRTVKMAG